MRRTLLALIICFALWGCRGEPTEIQTTVTGKYYLPAVDPGGRNITECFIKTADSAIIQVPLEVYVITEVGHPFRYYRYK